MLVGPLHVYMISSHSESSPRQSWNKRSSADMSDPKFKDKRPSIEEIMSTPMKGKMEKWAVYICISVSSIKVQNEQTGRIFLERNFYYIFQALNDSEMNFERFDQKFCFPKPLCTKNVTSNLHPLLRCFNILMMNI